MIVLLVACQTSPVSAPPQVSGPLEKAEPLSELESVVGSRFCRLVPDEGSAVCWHSEGGLFGPGACGDATQCCEGVFAPTQTCGPCLCEEGDGALGCVPQRGATEVCFSPFEATVEVLDEVELERMRGVTWKPGCPVALHELAMLTIPHWGFDGKPTEGRLVVRAELAPAVLEVFRHAWEVQFPIERMEPASLYGGDDKASMAVNNTSAFNCRAVTGGTRFSEHSYGHALDLNPRQNPYVSASGRTVLPPEGRAFLERDATVPGLITDPGPIVGAFRQQGWGWGGNWARLKDYQHFSENNR